MFQKARKNSLRFFRPIFFKQKEVSSHTKLNILIIFININFHIFISKPRNFEKFTQILSYSIPIVLESKEAPLFMLITDIVDKLAMHVSYLVNYQMRIINYLFQTKIFHRCLKRKDVCFMENLIFTPLFQRHFQIFHQLLHTHHCYFTFDGGNLILTFRQVGKKTKSVLEFIQSVTFSTFLR